MCTHATESLFKAIISAHVFILYYKVSNNYARALKDEETFTSRRTRIDYSRRAFPVHRFAAFSYISASKLALCFFQELREPSPPRRGHRLAEDTFHLEILSRAPPLIVEIVSPDDDRPLQRSFSRRNPLFSLFLFLTADIQRYIKRDPFFG